MIRKYRRLNQKNKIKLLYKKAERSLLDFCFGRSSLSRFSLLERIKAYLAQLQDLSQIKKILSSPAKLAATAMLLLTLSGEVKAETTYSTTLTSLASTGYYFSKPAFADIDGDGDLDMVVTARNFSYTYADGYYNTTQNDKAFIYINQTLNPGSSFEATLPALAGNYTYSSTTGYNINSYSGFSGVFADLDGDGDQDLVFGYDHDSYTTSPYAFESIRNIKYYENTGTSLVSSNEFSTLFATPVASTSGTLNSMYLVNVDGDTDLDLILKMTSSTTPVIYYRNDGSTFTEISLTDSANPFLNIKSDTDFKTQDHITFADLDGDGNKDDFFTVGSTGVKSSYFKNTSGVFSKVSTGNPFGGFADEASNDLTCTLADIDGDGDEDFVVGQEDGTIQYYEAITDGDVNTAPAFGLGGTGNPAENAGGGGGGCSFQAL